MINDQDDTSSENPFQTVPRNIQEVRSIDKNFMSIPSSERNSLTKYRSEKKTTLSPDVKVNSPLVKRLYLTKLNNDEETSEFKLEAMSEF